MFLNCVCLSLFVENRSELGSVQLGRAVLAYLWQQLPWYRVYPARTVLLSRRVQGRAAGEPGQHPVQMGPRGRRSAGHEGCSGYQRSRGKSMYTCVRCNQSKKNKKNK